MERERDMSKNWDQRSQYSSPYGGQHSYRNEQDDHYRNSYKWEKKDPPTIQNKEQKRHSYFSGNAGASSRDSGTTINLYSRKELSNDGRDYLNRSVNNPTPGGQDFSAINNTINIYNNNSSSFYPKEQHNSNSTRWESPSGSVSPQNFEFAQRSTKLQDDYRPAKIDVERKDGRYNRSYDNRSPTFVDRTHHSSFEKRNDHSKKFYDDESKIHLEKKTRNYNVAETCFEESDCHFKRANVGVAETHMAKRDSYSKINYDDEPQIRLERRYSDHSPVRKYDDILHVENRDAPNNRHRNRSSDRFEKGDSRSSRNYDDESKMRYRKRHYDDVFHGSASTRSNYLSETEKRDHYSKNCSDDKVDHTRLAKRVGNSNKDYNDQLKKGRGNDNRFNRYVDDTIQSRSEKKDGHYNRNYGDTSASLEKRGGPSKVCDGMSKIVFEKNRYKRNYSLDREGRNLESGRDWSDRNYDCKNKTRREEGNVITAFGNLTSLCTKEERSYSNSQNFNSKSTAVSHTAAWCMDDDSNDDPWEDADIVSSTDCVKTPLPDKDTPGKRKRKRVHRNWRKRDIEWQRKKALQNTANVRVETQTIDQVRKQNQTVGQVRRTQTIVQVKKQTRTIGQGIKQTQTTVQVRATENINTNLKFTTPHLTTRIVPIDGKKKPRKKKKNKFNQMNTGTENRNNHSLGIASSRPNTVVAPIKGAINQKQEVATDLLDDENGSRTMGNKYVGQIMTTNISTDNVVETRNDNIVKIKEIDKVDNAENIDTIMAAGNANQFPQIENIYNTPRYDNIVETRNDNIVQIKGIDRVDNAENIDTIMPAGNANQFPQIENIYNTPRYDNMVETRNDNIVQIKGIDRVDNAENIDTIMAAGNAKQFPQIENIYNTPRYDNMVETRNDNIVQIKGIDRVDNAENIDTIMPAGNANQFPQIENIYNALRYLTSPMFGNIIVIPNIIPTANTVPIFNVPSNSVPTENRMIPKKKKRDKSLRAYLQKKRERKLDWKFMIVTAETALKLQHPEGVNFLRILGERTNMKLDVAVPGTSHSFQYTVTLEGSNEHKPKAIAAIKRYCGLPAPEGIEYTLSELKPSRHFTLEHLRSILKKVNNRSTNWRKVTGGLFAKILETEVEIGKTEQLLSTNQFATLKMLTDCKRMANSLAMLLKKRYKALNTIVLVKLEVGNVVHVQALKQWADSGDPPEAPVSLRESNRYVFHNNSSLGIDYAQIINRLPGDETFAVIQVVNNLFQCGLVKCITQRSESAMRQLKDMFCEVVIDDYDGESLDAFKTFCAQLG